jgi:hypothetical protein
MQADDPLAAMRARSQQWVLRPKGRESYDAAIGLFQRALAFDPSSVEARSRLAITEQGWPIAAEPRARGDGPPARCRAGAGTDGLVADFDRRARATI